MKIATLFLIGAAVASAEPRVVALPGKSPLISFRIVFRTGAASDPAAKPGAASLTAAMLSDGGTKDLTYKQILDEMFPMAAGVSSGVDKEMTVFAGTTHIDNLERYYGIFRAMLLEPGWRDDDFKRLRDLSLNYLKVNLRGNNDEELGKEVMYTEIYKGHPYGHNNTGTVSSLQKMTIDDVKAFYAANYTQANLTIGLAGGYPAGFEARVKKDFAKLPEGKATAKALPAPNPPEQTPAVIVKKAARSVAYSFGYPIEVRRGHPDYPALLVAQSWFGQHRSSGGRLFGRMREVRGLNYGDYAYIEHFPNGMFRMEPQPNIARQQQVFQIWVRPVEVPTAHFALRLAIFELDRLIRQGLTPEEFNEARNFLTKHVNLLTSTKSAELGYAIDSQFYGIPNYNSYLKTELAKLTAEDVNRAIKRHLRTNRMVIVAIAEDAAGLKDKLVTNARSPMTYNSPKPEDVLAEDKVVQAWRLPLTAETVQIIPVESVFQ